MRNIDCIPINQHNCDELSMRNLIWVTTVLFVISAVSGTRQETSPALMASENIQVAACGAVLGLAMWPKLKKIFGA